MKLSLLKSEGGQPSKGFDGTQIKKAREQGRSDNIACLISRLLEDLKDPWIKVV